MNYVVSLVLYSFVLVSSLLFVWYKLLNKKINFKNPRLYITLVGLMICSVFNYFLVNKFIKIVLITIIFMLFFRFLFKEKIQNCIVTPIFYQLMIMIVESLYALVVIMLNFDINETINSFWINMISNIIIAILSIILSKINLTKKFYSKVINFTDKISEIQLSLFCIMSISVANILSMTVYYKIPIQYLLIFNVSLTLLCCFIVFYSFKTQNSYNKVYDKYNIAINSLNDYEEMMSKYRVDNHENKNLLLAIRAMVINHEKDIPKYINSIIKDKYSDNERLLMKVNVIPVGGLRATIYSEILKIKKKNINYELMIDKKLKTINFIELDTNMIIDICKIIGVFIDNAIEEVDELNEKNIGINLYIEDNNLIIEISNNYSHNIQIEKIFEKGYTTKSNGHGYGLYMVKEIIEKNNKLENKINISKNIFTQVLKVNLNNNKK